MLHGLVLQYLLFAAVCLSTLSHTGGAPPTIETHVFNASATLLLAGAYILVGAALAVAYHVISQRTSHLNPDLDYCSLQEELAELDPDVELADPALEYAAQPRPARPAAREPVQAVQRAARAARAVFLGPDEPEADGPFFLEVYGLGVVIFVVYYSVDLVLLAPALGLLCGLLVLSARDALLLLRAEPTEPMFAPRLVSAVATLLLASAVSEMLLADSRELRDALPAADGSLHTLVAYVLPLLACAALGALPRTCSHPRKIRRAAPLAALLALGVVAWVLGLDSVADERDYYRGAVERIDSAWHDMLLQQTAQPAAGAPAAFPDTGTMHTDEQPAAFPDTGTMHTDEQPAAWRNGTRSDQNFMSDYALPAAPGPDPEDYLVPMPAARRSLPLASVLVEPLLKLALTLAVITAVVNHKAPETTAMAALLTAAKQLAYEPIPDVRIHLTRSCVISAVAAAFCALRYVPALHGCLSRLSRSG